jgi:hypothetical protein
MQMTKVNQCAKNPDVVRHVGDGRASQARLLSNMSAISGCMTSLHEESSDHWPQKEGGNSGERSVSNLRSPATNTRRVQIAGLQRPVIWPVHAGSRQYSGWRGRGSLRGGERPVLPFRPIIAVCISLITAPSQLKRHRGGIGFGPGWGRLAAARVGCSLVVETG